MTGSSTNRSLALLPPGYRASGILLHVTSLPSRWGIGDLGPEAFRWIDRLAASNQSWWQLLPLGPTGSGNSPYDPLSTFAGNTMLISPDQLLADGLVETLPEPTVAESEARVDFEAVAKMKRSLFELAWQRFRAGAAPQLHDSYQQFSSGQSHWLQDYSAFIAIKKHFDGQAFFEWPEALAKHDASAVQEISAKLADEIDFVRFTQFLFFRQWWQLKAYAQQAGVRILGDLPFFVSYDSSEVWAHPELFRLDANRKLLFKAGVPPDYFSATGQLWGNPTYDWPKLQSLEYKWWVQRLTSLLQLVDGVRLDHFRAFSAAWHVPAKAKTAERGEWIDCPGTDLFAVVRDTLGGLPFIAEDLGLITQDVRELRDQFGMPGMRILQFAFDGDPANIFLPEHYIENSAAFTGTHDNNTTRGWYMSLNESEKSVVGDYFGDEVSESNIAPAMLRAVWESKSALAIAPLQDVLNLDGSARMNVPGTAHGNWAWRATRAQFDDVGFDTLSQLTTTSQRSQ